MHVLADIDIGNLVQFWLNVDIAGKAIKDMGAMGWSANPVWLTLQFALIAEGIGILVGLFLALGLISRHRWLRVPARLYVEAFRGTPLLVQIMFIYYAFPNLGINLPQFTAGVLALSLNSAAYVAEIFRAGIESVERGQMEAARSLGMRYSTAMTYVILPQAFRRVVPPLTNEFVALIKDSSLVSVIGAVELLKWGRNGQSTYANSTPMVVAALMYLAMTVPLTRLSAYLEKRLKTGHRPRRRPAAPEEAPALAATGGSG